MDFNLNQIFFRSNAIFCLLFFSAMDEDNLMLDIFIIPIIYRSILCIILKKNWSNRKYGSAFLHFFC